MFRKVIVVCICVLVLASCSSNNTQEFDALKEKSEGFERMILEFQTENEDLTEKIKELEKIIEEQKNEITTLNEKYSSREEELKPYLTLSLAEAEARQAELDAKKEEERLAKEAAEKEEKERIEKERQEEEARRAEEEARGYETGITYDNLARDPDSYNGKKVKFTGTIIQVIEDTMINQYRLAINDDYDQIILLTVINSLLDGKRILEDDTVTIYGVSSGIVQYESVMGGKISIPEITVSKIDN